MRFLCLHGGGTNSQILSSQTAALRYELSDRHAYEFVQGVLQCPAGPGLEAFSFPADELFAYFDPFSPTSYEKALDDLRDYVQVEGPFDGILAFSYGAALAAGLIIDQKQTGLQQGIKCAIFVSGVPPYDRDAAKGGKMQQLKATAVGEIITIPTVHINGSNDRLTPRENIMLRELCKGDCRWVVTHEGGHEVPGTRMKKTLVECAHMIRRAVAESE